MKSILTKRKKTEKSGGEGGEGRRVGGGGGGEGWGEGGCYGRVSKCVAKRKWIGA